MAFEICKTRTVETLRNVRISDYFKKFLVSIYFLAVVSFVTSARKSVILISCFFRFDVSTEKSQSRKILPVLSMYPSWLDFWFCFYLKLRQLYDSRPNFYPGIPAHFHHILSKVLKSSHSTSLISKSRTGKKFVTDG